MPCSATAWWWRAWRGRRRSATTPPCTSRKLAEGARPAPALSRSRSPETMTATDELCRSYLDLRWHFDPAEGSAAGAVAVDGLLGRFDADALREHLAAFRALAGAAEELDSRDLAEEVDRTALLDDVRVTLFRFERERPHVRNPDFWLNHVFQAVYALLAREGPVADRAPALLARLEAVPGFLDAARGTVEEPPQVFVDSALASLGGGGELLTQAAATFGGSAPDLAGPLNEATRKALEALAAFGRALARDIAPSDDPHAFAVGEEQFDRRLHHEHALRGGAGEIWRYGMHLLEEVEGRVTAAAREVDAGRPWRDTVTRLRADGVPDGDVLGRYRVELERARGFVAEHRLVELPSSPLTLTPTPAFLAPATPFAAYEPPPVELGGSGRFYVTAGAAYARGHCVHDIPSTVAHEAFPGHHLQFAAAQGLRSAVRRHLWSPVAVEGWALYAETLMAEAGFFATPESRLFHLVNLLWRAERIVLDVGLHTMGLPFSRAVDELMARIPMERRSAEGEVRRYCAMPTYQLSY